MEITTDYTNLALAYRNRLLYLFLSNKEQDQFNQLHSQLTQFLRLTHLEVQLENNNGGLFDLEPIEIEGCKSLNSIKFESKSQNDLTINKAPQDLVNISSKNQVTTFISEPSTFLLTDNIFKYFIHKFPNLIKISGHFRLDETIGRSASFALVETLFRFVSKLRSIDVRFDFESPSYVIDKYLGYAARKNSNTPKEVSLFYQDPNAEAFNAPLQLRQTKWDYPAPYFDDRRDEANDMPVRNEDGLDVFFSIAPYLDINNTAELAHKQILQEVSDKVEDLDLSLYFVGEHWQDADLDDLWQDKDAESRFREDVHESIPWLLKKCTSLKTLTLNYVSLLGFDHPVINNTLHTINIVSCTNDSKSFFNFCSGLKSLKNIVFDDSFHGERDDIYICCINVPNLSLEDYCWKTRLYNHPQTQSHLSILYLKVTTLGEEEDKRKAKYIALGTDNMIQESTEDEFK